MKLDLKAIRVVKSEYRNEMGPNFKMNLQVNMNNQIKLPKPIQPKSIGSVISKVMVGSPLLPLYIYVEQICYFGDSEPDENLAIDDESMMSLYKTICVPIAMKQVQETLDKMCEVYRIPKIKLQKNPSAPQQGNTGYLN